MGLDALLNGMAQVAGDMITGFPFRFTVLVSQNQTATEATGYPAPDDFQPGQTDIPGNILTVKGREVEVDGKTQSFTGYLVTLKPIIGTTPVTVGHKDRLLQQALGARAARTFEIEFVGDDMSPVLEVFCQLLES